jgi:hypothetical protein
MLLALPVALVALAQAASAAPPAATAPKATSTTPVPDGCRSTLPGADSRVIIVCGQRPQGYRLDPDVIQARREARNHTRPKPPEMMKDNPCATVGPMGCRGGGGIDLVSAGLVAAQMLAKAAKGENVGKMFVTDPQPTEYQLYQEAKREREQKEADATAKAAKAAARAPRTSAAESQSTPATTPSTPESR